MKIRNLKHDEFDLFKQGIQEAFQKGYETYFGPSEELIIPDQDILESYHTKGSQSFVAVEDEQIMGGAIVVIDDVTQYNHLHILYVKVGSQSKGIGYKLWSEIEKIFPNTKVWATCTPYFDKRNINFYVNKCGFHIVKYIPEHPKDSITNKDFIGDAGEGMFEFEKVMS